LRKLYLLGANTKRANLENPRNLRRERLDFDKEVLLSCN
jgi:hypothetical protein